MKRYFYILSILVTFLMLFSACNNAVEPEQSTITKDLNQIDTPNKTDSNDEVEKPEPIEGPEFIEEPEIAEEPEPIEKLQVTVNVENINYIAIQNLFLGTFEDGKWNSNQSMEYQRNKIEGISNVSSIRDITIEEINQSETYYLYNKTNKIEETNEFSCLGDDGWTSGSTFSFINYDFNVNGEIMNSIPLGLTHNYNPIPQNLKTDVSIKDNHTSAVRKVLDDNGLSDTEINISEIVSADIDNDGIVEDIIIAGTPYKEDGYPKINPDDRFKDGAGVYITAIILKNDKVIPIYFQGEKFKNLKYDKDNTVVPFGVDACLYIDLIGIFDLNNDGKYEICILDASWDCPEIRVYEWQEDNTIKEVLYGDFGW